MTGRPVVTIFLVGHLAALAVSAIPSPGDLKLAEGVRESADDAVSSRVRPLLDWAAGLLQGVAGQAWRVSAPARPLLTPYVDRLGLVQNWSMFGNPPRGSEYLRFRYYYYPSRTEGERRPLMVATELVFPVAPESESHLVAAYRQAHRDKAVSNALIAYFRQRLDRVAAGRPSLAKDDRAAEEALRRNFNPMVHFFSDQYARAHLAAGDRLVRTEAWYGFAPSRQRGDAPLAPQSRATAIERYYRSPAAEAVSNPAFRAVDGTEQQADVLWMLVHIQTP